MLYCTGRVKILFPSDESDYSYQTLGKDLELILGIEVLLSKNT